MSRFKDAPPARRGDTMAAAPHTVVKPSFRTRAGAIAQSVVESVRRARVEAATPTKNDRARVLPPGIAAFRVKGGAEALGHELELEGRLLPWHIVSVGDLVIEPIDVTDAHDFAPTHVVRMILAVQPRRPVMPAADDAELVARLEAEAGRRVTAIRDHGQLLHRDPELLLETFFRAMTQDLRLSPAHAERIFKRYWEKMPELTGPAPFGYERHVWRPSLPPKIGEGLLALAFRMARADEWLLDGAACSTIAAQLDADRRAEAQTKAAEVAAVARATETVKTTPRAAGALVLRRWVGRKPGAVPHTIVGPREVVLKPLSEAVVADYQIQTFARVLPPDVDLSRFVAVDGGVDVAPIQWEICSDDEEIELNVDAITRAPRIAPPPFVLAAVRERLMEQAAGSSGPITAFVDMKSPGEYRRRIRLLRDYLKAVDVHLFTPSSSMSAVEGFVVRYGIERLALHPLIVASELVQAAGTRVRYSTVELVSRGYNLAAEAQHVFAPMPVGGE